MRLIVWLGTRFYYKIQLYYCIIYLVRYILLKKTEAKNINTNICYTSTVECFQILKKILKGDLSQKRLKTPALNSNKYLKNPILNNWIIEGKEIDDW